MAVATVLSYIYQARVKEILNLQPINSKCKSYQVKQIRDIILRYNLRLEE